MVVVRSRIGPAPIHRGDNEALRAFVNTALAKTWREEAATTNPEPRLGRHIYAIKGMDGARPIWPRRAGKSRKLPGSNVWTVGVDTAKDAIFSKLKVTTPGPGYCHFPIAYQQEFFNQLTSEEVRTRFVRGHPVRYWFKPSGKRNEALDRRVYAFAALHARPVPWEVLLRAAPTEPPPPRSPPEGGGATRPAPSSPLPAAASRFQRRRLRFKMK